MRWLPEQSELHISLAVPARDFGVLQARTEAFMIRYPHIRVELTNESPSSNRYESVVERSTQGSVPDVMLVNNGWVIPLAVQGFLKPIDSLMSGDSLSDQLPGLLEPMKWNGYLWGAPRGIDPYIFAWNKPLLEQYGMAKPPSDWTAFLELADRIAAAQEDEQGKRVALTSFAPGGLLQLLLWTERFDAAAGSLLQLRSLSDAQLSMLAELQARSSLVESMPIGQAQKLDPVIADNRILLLLLPWSDYDKLSESAKEHLLVEHEYVPTPWLSGSSFVIGAATEHEEDAMLWIQEMTNAAVGMEELLKERKLPVRASLYDSPDGLLAQTVETPPDWWLRVLNEKSAEPASYHPDPDWPLRWKAWQEAWVDGAENETRFRDFADAIEALNPASK
nr:extracellular solute-binding protein [Paenibacillus soyae]